MWPGQIRSSADASQGVEFIAGSKGELKIVLTLGLRGRQTKALAATTRAMESEPVSVIHAKAGAANSDLTLPGTLQAYEKRAVLENMLLRQMSSLNPRMSTDRLLECLRL